MSATSLCTVLEGGNSNVDFFIFFKCSCGTADILTCHSGKSTAVTNDIFYGSILSYLPINHERVTLSRQEQYNPKTEPAKWNSAFRLHSLHQGVCGSLTGFHRYRNTTPGTSSLLYSTQKQQHTHKASGVI